MVFADLDKNGVLIPLIGFVDAYSRHVLYFNSKFLSQGSEAADALTYIWGGETNWWCPPSHLIT